MASVRRFTDVTRTESVLHEFCTKVKQDSSNNNYIYMQDLKCIP